MESGQLESGEKKVVVLKSDDGTVVFSGIAQGGPLPKQQIDDGPPYAIGDDDDIYMGKPWSPIYSYQEFFHGGTFKPAEIDIKVEDWLAPPTPKARHLCPHYACAADWHSGPLTRRVQQMFASHTFDPTYDPDEDDSVVLCPGSDHYGPVQDSPGWTTAAGYSQGGVVYTANEGSWQPTGTYVDGIIKTSCEYIQKLMEWPAIADYEMIMGFKKPEPFTFKLWLSGDDEDKAPKNLPIKYDSAPWKPWEKPPEDAEKIPFFGTTKGLVMAAFIASEAELPATPGIDYAFLKELAEQKTKQPYMGGKKKQ